MLSKNRAVFLRDYKDFIQTKKELKHSHLHKEFLNDVKALMDKNELKLNKAVSRAVNSRKRKFDELLEPDESDSEESDTEEADDSATDENTE